MSVLLHRAWAVVSNPLSFVSLVIHELVTDLYCTIIYGMPWFHQSNVTNIISSTATICMYRKKYTVNHPWPQRFTDVVDNTIAYTAGTMNDSLFKRLHCPLSVLSSITQSTSGIYSSSSSSSILVLSLQQYNAIMCSYMFQYNHQLA